MKEYSLNIYKKLPKEIKKLPQKKQNLIKNTLRNIKKNPYGAKKLKGEYEGLYSYRVGSYRIVYEIDKKRASITILDVEDRKDVY
jgi:mRNA interferase RelE/StbE